MHVASFIIHPSMSFQKFFYVLSLDGVLGVIFKYEVQHCTSNQPVKPTLDSSLSLDIWQAILHVMKKKQ